MDLTSRKPFRLAGFEVTPARAEIVRGDVISRVEPKVMEVLVALAEQQGETVSRDRLIEDVWHGRAVTDDALTRCISALRRVFRNGEGVEIKALPKLGYVLTVAQPATAAAPSPASESGRRHLLPVAAAALLLIGAAIVVSFRSPLPRSATDGRVLQLTSLPGLELYPALAPAGGHVAFAHKDTDGQWDLYVKAVAGGEPQRLTDDEEREQHPAWSSAGDELVFVRRDDEQCEIMRLAVPGGEARKIADCDAALVNSLDWSPDGALLALSLSDGRLDPGRVAFVALKGATPHIEIDPKLSAEDVRFSPDGKTVALTLSTAIGAEDVYTGDLATGALTRLTSDNAKIHGLDWSADGRDVIYASNRAGSFGLHRVSLNGGAPASLMPALHDIENPTVVGTRIVYESWTESGGLNALALTDGAQTRLPPDSTRLEWHPDVAVDGAITFVSDRGGAPEVWFSKGRETKQLTWFGDAYIHTPKFSPDGAHIVFSAPRDGHFNLFTVDRDGDQRRLTNGDANDMSPAWSRDGKTLYFASDREGKWRVWKLDLASEAVERVSDVEARAVYVLGPGELLVVDPTKGGLYRLDLATPSNPALVAPLAPSDWANVTIKNRHVFYINREPPDRAVLHRLDLASREDEAVQDLEDFYFRSGLAVANDALIYATTKVEDVSLMRLERELAIATRQ